MKNRIQLLCLFIGLTLTSFAQMTKGKISYDMVFSSDNAEMAMGLSMMQGSKMDMYFMPGKSRSDVSMGMMGTMSTIADEKTKKVLMLMDMMGMKYAVESEMDDKKTEATEAQPEYKVEITTEKKDIVGYECTKAIMTDEADGSPMTVWFTNEIDVFTQGQNYYNKQMPGFPMAFSFTKNDMTIEMTATAVEKKVDKKIFAMKVPEGYEVKTEEELQIMGE